jgi:CIC family chloride channel protein
MLNGQFTLQACLVLLALKLLATACTFGMGGVGGLFVPSATIGAALGAACDLAFQPSQPGIFTLVGIAAFTGASYNSLLFAAVFVAEASGSAAIVVPGLLASTIAFLVSAGVSNSPSQRSRRPSDDAALAATPCGRWMTRVVTVAAPHESLAGFVERAVREHRFRALPVVDADRRFLGMASLSSLRGIAAARWPEMTVAEIMDRTARTVCPTHSMGDVETALARGPSPYLPVVDPASDRVVGIVSPTDVLRARRMDKERSHEQAPVQDSDLPARVPATRR